MLAKSKLNSIETLVSQALIDVEISYEEFLTFFTLFRMEGWQKCLPTSFSPVTSTNVRISSKNFLIFNFNPFDRLV